jgi:hypothetical protein
MLDSKVSSEMTDALKTKVHLQDQMVFWRAN